MSFSMLQSRQARTWLMDKNGLASVGILYRTDEGISDFHAASLQTRGQETGPSFGRADDDEVHARRR